MNEFARLEKIRQSVCDDFLRRNGVIGVGLGGKVRRGAPTDQPAIVVFVVAKRAADEIAPAERIPSEVFGVPTDVETMPAVRQMTAGEWDSPGIWHSDSQIFKLNNEDSRSYRDLLVAGCQVRSEIDFSSSGFESDGTLGFFALTTGSPQLHVAVTNHHVVFGPGGSFQRGALVGQPIASDCCGACPTYIGRVLDGRETSRHDTAVIVLNAGQRYRAEVLGLGGITGSKVPSPTEIQAQTFKAAKRGRSTLVTAGIVRAVNTSITDPAESSAHFINRTIVKPHAAVGPGGASDYVRFAVGGDSGCPVLTEARELIGILDAVFVPGVDQFTEFPGESLAGYGSVVQIDRIESDFELTVQTSSGASDIIVVPSTQAFPEAAAHADGVPAPEVAARARRFEQALLEAEIGRLFHAAYHEHVGEIERLVRTNRRVGVVWRRAAIPELMQSLVRAIHDPSRRFPERLGDAPTEENLARVAAVLARHGSAKLRRDIPRILAPIPGLVGRTYEELLGDHARARGRDDASGRDLLH